jgi:hypothetical protein
MTKQVQIDAATQENTMSLRRLSKAFRKQDWFTVFVETLIVVFGVFIGLQVDNWNNENTLRFAERQLLLQLQNDVQAAVILKTEWLAETQVHRTSLIEAINVIQNIPEQETTSSEQCRAMWSSHLLFYPVTPLGTLNEVLLKGNLFTARGKVLRPSLLKYRDQHTVIDQLNTTLSDLANLGDKYSDAFPRHLTQLPKLELATLEKIHSQLIEFAP